MSWFAFALPVVGVALLVRLEAKAIGPYWAWLEMLSELGFDDSRTARQRRLAFIRRVAIPGVIAILLRTLWPGTYDSFSLVVVGISSAGLLLWPLLFGSLPADVPVRTLTLVYSLLVLAFAASSWLGGYVADVAHAEGGLWNYIKDNAISMLIGVVLTAFSTGALVRVSGSASASRERLQSED